MERFGSSRPVHMRSGSQGFSASSSGGSAEKNMAAEVGSILIFAVAVFSLCALFTYSPNDPGFFSNSRELIENSCGRVGAYLASALLQCFGMGSFLFPAALGFIAATVYKREGWVRLIGTLGGMTVAVMSLTVFLSLQWKFWPFSGTLLLTGGAFGDWVAQHLTAQFNPLGSSLVSLLVFCLAIALSTPVSVARLGAKILRSTWKVVSAVGVFCGTYGWKATRLLGTYLLYLLGLLAMRLAHGAGDVLQKMIEGAARRARERLQAMKAAAERRREIEVSSDIPEIDESSSEARETEEGSVAPKTSRTMIQLPLPSVEIATSPVIPSEAPNALPELEGASAVMAPIASPTSPDILPHEPSSGGGAVSAAAGEGGQNKSSRSRIASRPSRRGNWKVPSLEFLRKAPKIESSVDRDKLLENSQILKQKFLDFGIEGEITAVRPGPVITLYEFRPGPGVKVSKIASLADDLSMALSAQSVRILAPLPGKSVVGIEIPSDKRETVFLREFLQHEDFNGPRYSIPVVMGKDIGGAPVLSDMARMPHLLCAGQTGSGKSVFMNGLICSLLYRFTPDEMRMILVDPKFIEFRAYQDIPHLLLPVVDDPKNASTALKWAVREMERRYRILAMLGARNLAGYNQKVQEMGAEVVRDLLLDEENHPEGLAQMSGGDWIQAFEPDDVGQPRIGKLPYIVVIIDELADLMMIARKEVEVSIARIAQKARAAGIHLVIATQRPSTDVVTGLIKANLPSRVSFQLASYIDSKTILDRAGAERLLGNGDMLFIPPGVSSAVRLHGAYVDDGEIEKITAFLRSQGKPIYRDEILVDEEGEENDGDDTEGDDPLFRDAVEMVRESRHASASYLQRHFKIGYNRAARMIETMEERGIVGPSEGARPREVLMR